MSAVSSKGFTLMEMLVSLAIGAFVALTAVSFVGDQVRLLDSTTSKLESQQESRVVLELLAAELRSAGLGVGYTIDGQFAGLIRGDFSVIGGASFRSDGAEVGGLSTDDLGIRFARGDVRTISNYTRGISGQVCSGGDFEADDLVLLMTRNGRTAHTARLGAVTPDACQGTQCVDGCETFNFVFEQGYETGGDAVTASYREGELFGDYREVVYFVAEHPIRGNELRRAEISADQVCGGRAEGCGVTVGNQVDALQVRVWLFDEVTGGWVDVTGRGSIDEVGPLRVDLELVARAERSAMSRVALRSAIEPGSCYPEPCDSQGKTPRESLRTTIEIRNAGRMQIR
ncbi:MAG: prepilin-type N-terminal cleavage/methylation domain-containing protein [Myxococcota bacterium]